MSRAQPSPAPACSAPRRALGAVALLAAACMSSAWAAPGADDAARHGSEARTVVQSGQPALGDGADQRLRQIIARAQAEPRAPATAVSTAPDGAPTTAPAWWGAPRVVHEVSSRASELVVNALSFLGVRYRYGGDHASSGFDCSGLVRHVYKETLGLVLPHNAAQQSREGEKVAENELRPGDLVFFNTLRRAFSHVGIYIGNGQFVHAPRPGQRVQIDSLDSPYWARRFDGARRLITHAAEPLLPSAQAASPDMREPTSAQPEPAAQRSERPMAALPISNAVPAGASPATTALMAGALLPRVAPESSRP